MISFPLTPTEAAAAQGEYRAGGTDVQERVRGRSAKVALVDLRDVKGLDRVEWLSDGSVRIGALVRIATLLGDDRLARTYPALVAAAQSVATPQIRSVATLGGNLLQRNRCWYFRCGTWKCFKNGGHVCPARAGNHVFGVCFDLGPCVAPHPSSLAVPLLAYRARFERFSESELPLEELFGDGSNGANDNQIGSHLLTGFHIPLPSAGESGTYRRVARRYAEWPLVEVTLRLLIKEAVIETTVAAGSVAPIPIRLRCVEDELIGREPTAETFARAASRVAMAAVPLPMTRYKVALLEAAVLHALTEAAVATAVDYGSRSAKRQTAT